MQNPFFVHATIGKEEGWKNLSFQRREAKPNRAIFHVLALKGSQTIYDIHKIVKHPESDNVKTSARQVITFNKKDKVLFEC